MTIAKHYYNTTFRLSFELLLILTVGPLWGSYLRYTTKGSFPAVTCPQKLIGRRKHQVIAFRLEIWWEMKRCFDSGFVIIRSLLFDHSKNLTQNLQSITYPVNKGWCELAWNKRRVVCQCDYWENRKYLIRFASSNTRENGWYGLNTFLWW